MNKVYYSTPFLEGDIGKGINEFVALLPEDSWVCIRDSDTLFMTPNQQRQIQFLVDQNPDFDLIGCRTNRLRSTKQAIEGAFEVDSIAWHLSLALAREKNYYGVIEELDEPDVIAGMFLLFRKSLWNEFKFEERSIQFDINYSKNLREAGKRLGIAQGLYLLHLYRYGSKTPFNAVDHILHCHNF